MKQYTVVTGAMVPVYETDNEIEAWDEIERLMRHGDTRSFQVLDARVEVDPEIRAYFAKRRHYMRATP